MRNVNAFAERKRSAILRYPAAILSVIAAVNIQWWMDILFQSAAHVSLFLCAANGGGIPAEILPRIFDLFVTTKPPAISQEITKAHGGIIKVSSHVGQGTSVQILLPVEANARESVMEKRT
jgi:signal transduction histidine kinase